MNELQNIKEECSAAAWRKVNELVEADGLSIELDVDLLLCEGEKGLYVVYGDKAVDCNTGEVSNADDVIYQ